jgi:hypothetical protein
MPLNIIDRQIFSFYSNCFSNFFRAPTIKESERKISEPLQLRSQKRKISELLQYKDQREDHRSHRIKESKEDLRAPTIKESTGTCLEDFRVPTIKESTGRFQSSYN